jgi:hypothetical protein
MAEEQEVLLSKKQMLILLNLSIRTGGILKDI